MKKQIKILLVEDELALREEVVEWLVFEGYQVVQASNGMIALDLIAKEKPDLILSDIMMPIMDGKRLLYELRASEQNKMTPFIFLSALSERDHIRHGMELGADDYVSKPFTRVELLNAISIRLKKQEEQHIQTDLALNSLRSQIIRHMPHELRTPLNSIIGFGGLLADSSGDFSKEEIAKMGENIMNGGVRMHRLVENYLLYVQLEFLKDLNFKPINTTTLESLIYEEAYLIAKKYFREKDLEVSIKPSTILADEFMLRKIIQELVDNACKFSHSGNKIFISGNVDLNQYQIAIMDFGSGMTTEEIESIGAFMQFKRDRNEQQGSGLGLSLVKRMMHLLGGAFIIYPNPDKGLKTVCSFKLT